VVVHKNLDPYWRILYNVLINFTKISKSTQAVLTVVNVK